MKPLLIDIRTIPLKQLFKAARYCGFILSDITTLKFKPSYICVEDITYRLICQDDFDSDYKHANSMIAHYNSDSGEWEHIVQHSAHIGSTTSDRLVHNFDLEYFTANNIEVLDSMYESNNYHINRQSFYDFCLSVYECPPDQKQLGIDMGLVWEASLEY